MPGEDGNRQDSVERENITDMISPPPFHLGASGLPGGRLMCLGLFLYKDQKHEMMVLKVVFKVVSPLARRGEGRGARGDRVSPPMV